MLAIPINIHVLREGHYKNSTIAPGWWRSVPQEELKAFISNWRSIAHRGYVQPNQSRNFRSSDPDSDFNRWPGTLPECLSEWGRVVDNGADGFGGILRCSQGIGIDVLHMNHQFGLIESGVLTLTSSRETVLGDAREKADDHFRAHHIFASVPTELAERITTSLRPYVTAKLNDLENAGMIPARFVFLRHLAMVYGEQILIEGDLK